MPDLMIERIVPWQLNGQKQSAFLCTPEHLDELAAGYLYTQGMIAGLGDIAELAGDENGLNVTLREGVARGARIFWNGCKPALPAKATFRRRLCRFRRCAASC